MFPGVLAATLRSDNLPLLTLMMSFETFYCVYEWVRTQDLYKYLAMNQ